MLMETGKLKRHLKFWCKFIKSNKESMIKIHMDDITRRIVNDYKVMTMNTQKMESTRVSQYQTNETKR